MIGKEDERARELMIEAESLGIKLFIEGGRLGCRPKAPEEFRAKIIAHKDALFELVLAGERPPEGVDSIDALRRFLPGLWKLVKISDGRVGLLWGVHARGVVVSLGPKMGLLTLDPDKVTILSQHGERRSDSD
jgi:hypothetical protein